MKLLYFGRQIFKKCDLFSTSQFLRYKGQADYKTASGGICSLLVVGVFVGLFMNIALQTINLQIINWISTTETVFDPVSTTISVDPKNNNFMFGINIMGINLNDPTQRFFDIYLVQRQFTQGGFQLPNKTIAMVPCTQQHFNINSQIAKRYNPLNGNQWLCPPLGYNFTLSGKFTSPTMKTVMIYLGKCYNSTDPSRPCVPDATINTMQSLYGQFYFSLVYANPLINPGDSKYLDYILNDRNFIRFTNQLGAMSNCFVEDYSIITDVSLLPYSDNREDDGIFIPDLCQNVAYQVTNDNYASFFLMKASSSITYQRSFNKIDSFLSYVGGLVGTILGFMLIVQSFTEMSFELNLSQNLFKYKQDETKNNFDSFNLLTYLRFSFYQFVNYFGLCKNWYQMIKYDECKQQMSKQLDIQLMIKKIQFLQRAVQVLLGQDQLYFLHLQQFECLAKIKRRRKKYFIREKVHDSKQVGNNQITEIQSEYSSDKSQQNSQKDKSPDNNTSMNNTIEMRKNLTNSNIDTIFMDNIVDMPIKSKKRIRNKKKSRKEQLQNLRVEMEEGNTISKKIYQGIDPIYLQEINKDDSFQKRIDGKLNQSKIQMIKVRGKETQVQDKLGFTFLND